ncbi:HPP family protein [Pseudoduganella namucuonensis]|uniref:CBS domain-containing membrane protein n=1 Tax=Pseudoduganella namucuonensis TaxID=1035707 RepID=A0A1I7LDN4_9BURK|nr:HPP family protein [Pseudoduganella namucuonensis]SFV07800.1 CBS domain-containing membrane protein [Pseudoduganella namucuonensis]
MNFLTSLLPATSHTSFRERARACSGAILALLATGLLSRAMLPDHLTFAFLAAPMGASAVLLFCLPASPLAQPWSVIGGNVVSGLVGAACARWLGGGAPVAALAVCLAIAAMFALRCLHPPGGAVALTAAMGGPAILAAGFEFPLVTVLLNSTLMVIGAMAYNNLTGRRYPHQQQAPHPNPHATQDPVPTMRLGFKPEDLDAVLKQYNQVLDVSRDDLEEIFIQTELQAYKRRFGVIRCGDIMSRDVATAQFGTPLESAWREMRSHRVAALPVLNRARRVIGLVTQGDFLDRSGLDDYAGMRARLRGFLRRSGVTHTEKAEVVGQIMKAKPVTATVATPIVELVALMADSGYHHIPVVDAEERFAGIVTQSDLVAALYENRLAEAPAA